jgi:ApaG protein
MSKNIPVIVTANAGYLASQSDPESSRFIWTYEITILNEKDEILQLLNRYWRITDMTGNVEEVNGPGVVGLQPLIKPHKPFIYSSFCQLPTPQGTMEGYYELQNLEEESFIVQIPKFILTAPSSITKSYRAYLH